MLGLDLDNKPRGARFDNVDDRVVSVALDLGLGAVVKASTEFGQVAQKLPAGRLYASGKAFIPAIKETLLTELMTILRKPGDASEAYKLENRPQKNDSGDPLVRCRSPITSGLPRNWEEVDVGHMVLAHEGYEDGWWEAVVVKRENDILTLRYRDSPKLPTFVRHLNTVALVNPGPLADKA
ncbi:hypothetical protein [Bradyrhizobium sp. CCGUVB14]|uniref:hypothetical protein n=1 Tax=Bradyrhizobium sp. CCGUVB14 TaxID=2949628 RepID=UPI0020B2F696|nr:hypothetical protein [Bradyrhizobium sp. CCGUVB14]MCP3441989.1 hypothetical protein [Bradyrhizobium sp. CCGUVB14]